MKKYLVIGNPIEHSLSPKLHNYWIKNNNVDAIYEKKLLMIDELPDIIEQLKNGKIDGFNVTIPFKQSVIKHLDKLTSQATSSQSVNTVYKENNKIIGHNTDIGGFELALKKVNYSVNKKTVFIMGAGGVAPSIIIALKKMGVSKIILSNRTKEKANNLKKIILNLQVIDWGLTPNFDMIINATSLGLKDEDEIKLDYSAIGKNKLFYDVIYNPKQTNFLARAKEFGHQTENGKMMFIYQAYQSFAVWHKILPSIEKDTIKLLD